MILNLNFSQFSSSKMFSSGYGSRTREAQSDKISERKQDTEKRNNNVNKPEKENQNTTNNVAHFILQPNDSIPKTVYYKRLCQKIALQNENLKFKNELQKNNKKSNEVPTNEPKQDKNEEFHNDNNILKKMLSPIDSEENLNCTLVICESDVGPSDSELDITPINQLKNCKESTENVSPKSVDSKIKQPLKKSKKMVIAPATIGVQNMSNKSLKCVEKLNRNLDANIQFSMNKSLENEVKNALSKDTQVIPITHNTQCDPKTDKELPITDIIHSPKSSSFGDISVIPSKRIEDEQTSVKRKSILIEKDNNTRALIQKQNICLNLSVDNPTSSRTTKNVDCLLVNNENQLDNSLTHKLNQFESELPVINCNNNSQTILQSNHSVKNSQTNKSVEASPANKTCVLPISTKVDQVAFTPKKATVQEDEKNSWKLTKVKKMNSVIALSPSINMSTKNIKCLSMNNEKKTSMFKQKNNELESYLPQLNGFSNNSSNYKSVETSFTDKTCMTSKNNEVDQVPFKKKRVATQNNHYHTKDLMKVNKSLISPIENTFVNLKSSSMINETKSSTTFKQKNNKSKSELLFINRTSNLSDLSKSNHANKSSSKNKSVETSFVHKTCMPSISIEVDQVPITRKRVVKLMNYNDTLKLIKANKSTITSIENSTLNVKDVMMTNEKKSFSLLSEQNNQLECKLSDKTKLVGNLSEHLHSNDCVKSSDNTINKKILVENPTINIEVEQGSIFRSSYGKRRVILHSPENNKQEIKQGRRVQLITIQDHYSEPLVSFNGAKKTEIDVSNKSIHIEKVVESSSLFYVPQVKKRRNMNFGNADL